MPELKEKPTLIKNARIVSGQNVCQGDLLIVDGHISLDTSSSKADQVIDADGQYLLPGFIDIHYHGGYLFDFTNGWYDVDTGQWSRSESLYEKGFSTLSRQLACDGITGFYLASTASDLENLGQCYSWLSNYIKSHDNAVTGARVLGGFLEGSFLNKTMAGAQNPDFVFPPSIETYDQIKGSDAIKLANIVPDFGIEALSLIRELTQRGVVVGAGHTNAKADQVHQAVDAGLRYCIHFTNGPTGGSYKPFDGGGVIEAVLQNDAIYAELILDGFHVNPAYILDIIRRKGPHKIIAITDAMFMTGTDVETFTLSGIKGHANAEKNCYFVDNKVNTLFGSGLRVSLGFENLLNWLTHGMTGVWYASHPQRELDNVLIDMAQMFAANPAKLMGLPTGEIKDGAAADLVLLDIQPQQQRYNVQVDKTFVAGTCVYDSQS